MTAAYVDNLAVALDERFGDRAYAMARQRVDALGCTLEGCKSADDRTLAWIDFVFGGTWSREAFCAHNVIARRDGAPVGFASYAPEGLRFRWLRGMGSKPGVGIFGPFGVDEAARGTAIGPALLTIALCGLRRRGFTTALIPAVGSERLAEYYVRECGAHPVERFTREEMTGAKARAVVLASGNGTNFRALAGETARSSVPVEIVGLVVNSETAPARERAREMGVETSVVAWERGAQTRRRYDTKLRKAVASFKPDLVLLLGWMHLLDKTFLEAFPEILNLHPAFLPLDPARDTIGMPDGSTLPVFRGPRAIRDAIEAGSPWIGASVHRVTLETDRGPVIVRVPLHLGERETEESAHERLRPLEHALVARAVTCWSFER